MAQWINWGDGHDGSPNSISGTVNTYAAMTATSGDPTVTTALSVSTGDQVLLHQTKHASAAGTWEIVKVASTGSGTFEATGNLVNSYSTGAQAVLIPQYTGGTISGTVTGTAWNGTVGGIIALKSNGDLTVSGSLSINTGGFRGTSTSAYQGEGYPNTGGDSRSANGNGGGGGNNNNEGGGGGGGGGHAAAGTNGTMGDEGTRDYGRGGSAVGLAAQTTLFLGGAGGTGGSSWGIAGGAGGTGGGIILIIAKNFTLSGTLNANASNGTTPPNSNHPGGGGGGAGGGVLIKTQVAVLGTNKINVANGTGGTGQNKGGDGGAGSVGRIRCDYFTSVSGSTTPTLSSAQDTTLFTPSSNFFLFF